MPLKYIHKCILYNSYFMFKSGLPSSRSQGLCITLNFETGWPVTISWHWYTERTWLEPNHHQRFRADSIDSYIYLGNGIRHTGYPQDAVVESDKTYEEYCALHRLPEEELRKILAMGTSPKIFYRSSMQYLPTINRRHTQRIEMSPQRTSGIRTKSTPAPFLLL